MWRFGLLELFFPPFPDTFCSTNILYVAVQNPVVSSIDELEDFARCRVRDIPDRSSVCTPKEMREWHSPKASKYKEAKDAAKRTPKKSEDDLESYSSVGTRSSSVPKSRATSSVRVIDIKLHHLQHRRLKYLLLVCYPGSYLWCKN